MTTESLRGFRVVPLSLDELRDAMSVRMMVETQALRAAIRNDDDAWATGIVSSLYALNVQAGRTGPEADIWTLEARHYAFHRALLAACKLPWTLEFASTASTRRRSATASRSFWPPRIRPAATCKPNTAP
ncbi:FCD domain-containing protein [Mesorhizobium sp. M1066]|uniref:FCD domain-containing protein n=1 Tax=Mesorhizobium opportunistum TaxID=593909 RepID=A0ABV1YJY0_9HYPH